MSSPASHLPKRCILLPLFMAIWFPSLWTRGVPTISYNQELLPSLASLPNLLMSFQWWSVMDHSCIAKGCVLMCLLQFEITSFRFASTYYPFMARMWCLECSSSKLWGNLFQTLPFPWCGFPIKGLPSHSLVRIHPPLPQPLFTNLHAWSILMLLNIVMIFLCFL